MRLGPGLLQLALQPLQPLRLGVLRAFSAAVGGEDGAGAAEAGHVVRFLCRRILQEWETHRLSFGGSHHFLPDHCLQLLR